MSISFIFLGIIFKENCAAGDITLHVHTVYRGPAPAAAALFNVVFPNMETKPLNEQAVTAGAKCVFTRYTGHIAGIDVSEAGPAADVARRQ